jgi:hypothetical protein
MIQRGYIAFDNIPRPLIESIDNLILMNKTHKRTNERMSKYTAPPNSQGDRLRSMRSLAIKKRLSTTCKPG